MEKNRYMDLLMVRHVEDHLPRLVLCESGEAHKGDMVLFGNDEFGIVERVAWANEESGDLVSLLREAEVVTNALVVYGKHWESELNHQ